VFDGLQLGQRGFGIAGRVIITDAVATSPLFSAQPIVSVTRRRWLATAAVGNESGAYIPK
jgi:hypothetical protein